MSSKKQNKYKPNTKRTKKPFWDGVVAPLFTAACATKDMDCKCSTAGSPVPAGDVKAAIADAERKLQEVEKQHNDKVAEDTKFFVKQEEQRRSKFAEDSSVQQKTTLAVLISKHVTQMSADIIGAQQAIVDLKVLMDQLAKVNTVLFSAQKSIVDFQLLMDKYSAITENVYSATAVRQTIQPVLPVPRNYAMLNKLRNDLQKLEDDPLAPSLTGPTSRTNK